MDRNIPHIRDIFSSSRKKSGEFQDLCLYEKSPRSRRKNKLLDFSNESDQENKSSTSLRKKGDKGKENVKYKNSDEARLIQDTRNSNNNNNQQQNTSKSYSSKTLTERDIRHLERHLSMKKTIRKQISRNLAQALVDNPNLFEPDIKKDTRSDYGRSYTKSKLAKSEQAVLDMLKVSIDDRDSGHSSPTTEVLARAEDEDYADNYNRDDNKDWNSDHRSSETKLLTNEITESKNYSPDKKSSIWKSMFSSRNKGKR